MEQPEKSSTSVWMVRSKPEELPAPARARWVCGGVLAAGAMWPDPARWTTLGCSFASLVGEVLFWIRDPLTVGDLKHEMPLLFESGLLETVLET